MKKLFFLSALLCASLMTFATDWSAIDWMPSTDPAYAEKFKIDPADGQSVVEVQNPFGSGLGLYTSFPMALKSCSLDESAFQIEGSGLLLFVTAFSAKETPVTVVDMVDTEYNFVVFYADGIPSAVENVAAPAKAMKVVEDGQLIIIRDGVRFNAAGQQIK